MKPLARIIAETRAEPLSPGSHKEELAHQLRQLAGLPTPTPAHWSLPRYAAALAATILLVTTAFTRASFQVDAPRAIARPMATHGNVLDDLRPRDIAVSAPQARLGDTRKRPSMIPPAQLAQIAAKRTQAIKQADRQ